MVALISVAVPFVIGGQKIIFGIEIFSLGMSKVVCTLPVVLTTV